MVDFGRMGGRGPARWIAALGGLLLAGGCVTASLPHEKAREDRAAAGPVAVAAKTATSTLESKELPNAKKECKKSADKVGRTLKFVGRDAVIGFLGRNLTLHAESDRAELDGFLVVFPETVGRADAGDAALSDALFESVVVPLLANRLFDGKLERILIDPGHGGVDSGATGKTTVEKELNLAAALELGRELEKRGYQVSYTRNSDTFRPLEWRAAESARAKAQLFVSIHHNAATDVNACGVETFVMNPLPLPSPDAAVSRSDASQKTSNGDKSATVDKSATAKKSSLVSANPPEAVALGWHVQRRLAAEAGKGFDRGLRFARFRVLRQATVPAVLVELAFISNSGDEKKALNAEYRRRMVTAMADGIDDYAGTVSTGKKTGPAK